MKFNPEEWRKLSERQRQAIIRKIEREEKRAKTVMVVMVYILVFALLLSLFAVMSSCPTPQDAAPKGQEYETQAQHKPSRPAFASMACLRVQVSGFRRADSLPTLCNIRPGGQELASAQRFRECRR